MSMGRYLTIAVVCSAIAGIAAPAASAKARRVASLPIVSTLGGIQQPGYGVLASDVAPSAGAEPYDTLLITPGGGRQLVVDMFGTSTQPVQASADPASGTTITVVASVCPLQIDQSQPRCALVKADTVGGTGKPQRVETPSADAADRLPSIYKGTIVFSRERPGGLSSELRVIGPGQAASRALPSGPQGTEEAGATGISLRGTRAAVIWRWFPRRGATRYTLRLQPTSGSKATTLVTTHRSDEQLVGPVWSGHYVIFGVRRKTSARWYRYDTSSRRYASAAASSRIATVGLAASSDFFWQTASATQIVSGSCMGAPCPVYVDKLPRFRPSSKPLS